HRAPSDFYTLSLHDALPIFRAKKTISVTPRLTMIQPTAASLSRLKLSPQDGQGSGGVNQRENSLRRPQRGQRSRKPRSSSVGGRRFVGFLRRSANGLLLGLGAVRGLAAPAKHIDGTAICSHERKLAPS